MNSSPAVRLLLITGLFASFARADEVDDYVKAQISKQHIPGLALAVVKNGHLAKSAGYGLANV
jgi:CubicO group peptidase (beta-lactamase class C family)